MNIKILIVLNTNSEAPVTNGLDPQLYNHWEGRSVFVVGDDQSIYSFRAADFTILMGFQNDFGDSGHDDTSRTMVKLEDTTFNRYKFEAANALISNNTERVEKVLSYSR